MNIIILFRCLYIYLWYNTKIQEIVSYFGDPSFAVNGFLPECFCNITLILLETIDSLNMWIFWVLTHIIIQNSRTSFVILPLTSLWHWYPNVSRHRSSTMPVFTSSLKFYLWAMHINVNCFTWVNGLTFESMSVKFQSLHSPTLFSLQNWGNYSLTK